MQDPAIASLFSAILNPVILGAFMMGAYTSLFLYAIYVFATSNERHRKGSQLVMFGVIVMLYVSSLMYLVGNWASINMAFVFNGDTSDDIIGWLIASPLFYSIFPETFRLLSILLADSILIWRCYVVWNHTWYMILPSLGLQLCNFVIMICNLVLLSGVPTALMLTKAKAGTAIFAITLANTVLCTVLIVARILQVGQVGGVRRYWGVMEMIIESSALYSITLILVLPFWVMPPTDPNSFPLTFVQEVNQGMLGIAPTLLYVRVIAGGARPDHGWTTSASSTAVRFTTQVTSDANTIALNSMQRSRTDLKEVESGFSSGKAF